MTPTWAAPETWSLNDIVTASMVNNEVRHSYIEHLLKKCSEFQDVVIADMRPFCLLTAPSLDALGCDVKQFRVRMKQLCDDGYTWQTARDIATWEALAAKGLLPIQ
ncbi:MAG: hypothetical protein LCI00_16850 [Chloroflexi bacterium]|nr:hypothetical protein [Chloroflexota bacterium]